MTDELGRLLDEVLVGGRRPVVVELSEPDPAWSQCFSTHRQRIVSALGATSTDVQHVGSTAVPGLAAKPVVDVQLAVDDLEVAVTALEAAGYGLRVREPGHRVVQWPSPDAANVHLHLAGDPALEERVRLRDRLSVDPAARQRDEDVKRALAGRTWPDVNHYAEAKGPVIRAILAEPGRGRGRA